MGFEDKAFDNSSSNTTDDLQGETHNRFLPPNVVYLFNVQDNPRPQNDIDILEQNIREKSPYLLKLLLQDKTTGRYIRWACDGYAQYGSLYTAEKEILPELITGENTKIIQPRTAKSKEEQQNRTKKSAEVFTPSWICNDMNNLCDDEWLGYANAFNTKQEHSWLTNLEKINFSGKKTWQKYVDSKRLEITCGEAPFLTSRYDTTTGEVLVVNQRIGIIDRKLRVICENTDNEADWFKWAKRAYEATYGYEFQGDNLLLARENLLYTFIDFYKHHFGKQPNLNQIKQIANILAWNIWQMDGLKECAPFDAADEAQYELFDNLPTLNFPINCRIKNWRTKQVFNFRDLKGDKTMKFDVVIGNPPYQESKNKTETQTQGNSNWIYPYFQFAADKISNTSCLIYPFGGWFDAPERLNGLGNLILNDTHTIKIKAYEGTSDKRAWYRTDKKPEPLFGDNANLSAGVSIILRSRVSHTGFIYSNRVYSDQEVFIEYDNNLYVAPNPVFIPILKKINSTKLSSIVKKGIFGIESDFVEKNPHSVSLSKNNWKNPIQLLTNDKSGSSGRAKLYWADKSSINKGLQYIDYYKVIMTSAYPKQKILCGVPTIDSAKRRMKELIEIMPPNSAFGSSRLSLFMSKNKKDCDNFIKYTETNFFAGLILQEPNRRSTIGDVIPLQDFNDNSDIDWSKSIPEIDKQLYAKYGLSEEEINFIEQNVKPME